MTFLRSQRQSRSHPVLARNEQARNNPEAYAPRPGLGVPAFNIPMEDYNILMKLNPALDSDDQAERKAAWIAFGNSAESLPYRLSRAAL